MKKMSRGATFVVIFCLLAATFVSAAEKIDINSAPLEDLIKIVNIGEVRALELISLRPFYSVDELIKIKGIGEKRLQDIKDQGLAWVDPLMAPPPTPEPPRPEPQTSVSEPEAELQASGESPAAVGQPATRKSPPLPLIAGAIAVFSGIIILTLKKRFK